ncbi:MAG: toprim domain-containing protein, partial [Acetobacteraceae bacterium]
EGYMDVIALHQAGFLGAVAPLGTALTEDQFGELWRLSPAPILCFDGDAAGARATERAILAALPSITPAQSLGIIRLPDKEDPDSYIQKRGRAAFERLLNEPRSLKSAIYSLLRASAFTATLEGRAQLKDKLEATAASIKDRNLSWEYLQALRLEYRGEFKRLPIRQERAGLARAESLDEVSRAATAERARILTAVLLNHPALLRNVNVDRAYTTLDPPPVYGRLREAMLGWADHADVLDSGDLINHLTTSGLAAEAAQTLAMVPVPLPGFASCEAMPGDAEAGWWHIFGLMGRGPLEQDVAAAKLEFERRMDQESQHRLRSLREDLVSVQQGETTDPDA